jgi:hypothetical protein
VLYIVINADVIFLRRAQEVLKSVQAENCQYSRRFNARLSGATSGRPRRNKQNTHLSAELHDIPQIRSFQHKFMAR